MKELWKPVVGWEDLYEVSNTGKVRSCDRMVIDKNGVKRFHAGRILKPIYGDRDHKRASVFLCDREGKMKKYTIARLVASAWCKGYEEGLSVDHIDGNTLNDSADNLEWVTLKENIQRGYRTGIMNHSKPIVLEDTNGNTFSFDSIIAACKFLGKKKSYLHTTIKLGHTIHGINGEIYKIGELSC